MVLVVERVCDYASADNKRVCVCVMTKPHPHQNYICSLLSIWRHLLKWLHVAVNETQQMKCLNYLQLLTPAGGWGVGGGEEITQFCRHYGKLVLGINYAKCGPGEINKPL